MLESILRIGAMFITLTTEFRKISLAILVTQLQHGKHSNVIVNSRGQTSKNNVAVSLYGLRVISSVNSSFQRVVSNTVLLRM
jgi:hypothetical protein